MNIHSENDLPQALAIAESCSSFFVNVSLAYDCVSLKITKAQAIALITDGATLGMSLYQKGKTLRIDSAS